MDASRIRGLKGKLAAFLVSFVGCFKRQDTRDHLPVYVSGQLSDLSEKSIEPMALDAGVAPRTLQEFMSQHKWNDALMVDVLQGLVRDDHAGPHQIGIIDETSQEKKGDKTPGVQRQWCGNLGKTENCMVTVHLGYAQDDFHCLLAGDLYLPQSWAADRERCREAGIPDEVVYRPKWQIALELYDRAIGNGLHFEWLTFDEGYGSKPDFLRGLSDRKQKYVGEAPRNFTGWLKRPHVVTRSYRKGGRGRGRKVPRLAWGSASAQSFEKMLNSREFRKQPWQKWRVKDTGKGPSLWETKHALFYPKNEQGLPAETPMHLIVARNVENPKEIKFFVSNAPPETTVASMLLVGFSRWHVERCFEDQKQEIGLDHWEGRRYVGLKRHLAISAVSYLFLSRMRQELRGEKSGDHGEPTPRHSWGIDPMLVASTAGDEGSDW